MSTRQPRRQNIPYGTLAGACSEVKRLWFTRDEELPLLEAPILQDEFVSDDYDWTYEDFKKRAFAMLDELPPRYKKVLYLRFTHGLTLEEIGDCFELTKESIRQIETKALRVLVQRMKHQGMYP